MAGLVPASTPLRQFSV